MLAISQAEKKEQKQSGDPGLPMSVLPSENEEVLSFCSRTRQKLVWSPIVEGVRSCLELLDLQAALKNIKHSAFVVRLHKL